MQLINHMFRRFVPTKQPPTVQQKLNRMATKEVDALDNLFAEHGLASRINRQRITASQVAGYMRYHIQRGDKVSKLTGLNHDISALLTELRGQDIKVKVKEPSLYIQLPFPFERRALSWSDIDLSSLAPHQMIIGRDYGGSEPQPITLNFRDKSTSNVLVSGIPGSGKTTALVASVLSLAYATSPQDAQIIIIDPKGSDDLIHLEKLPHVTLHVDTDDSAQAIASVKAELNRRKLQGDRRKVYLIVEELAELTIEVGSDKSTMFDWLKSIAGLGREKNVHVLACTQKPHTDIIDTVLRGNLPIKLAGKVSTGEESKIATGLTDVGCEHLPGKGSFYFVNGAGPQRVQTHYLTLDDMTKAITDICCQWVGHEPYRIDTVAPAVTLPTLPNGVDADQLFAVVGAFTYGQIFNNGKLRKGKQIEIIRTVWGSDADDQGSNNRWVKAAVPYLRDHWQEIADAKEL